MPLVIVESPNKCAKIKKILGPGYTVIASVGHIMDLSKKNMGIDTDTWTANYLVSQDKKDVVKNIKLQAKQHDEIYIATDADREGSGIAFHIKGHLPKRGKKIYRSIFKTITKKDVLGGIKNPIPFNEDLYDAQQARRMTDRLVGFRVSPVMWNKGLRGTSAGRVQSVALKFIADKEKIIQSFVPDEYWEISVSTKLSFDADFYGINGKATKLKSQADADKITSAMDKKKDDLIVSDFTTKKRARKPAPPFITSTMQQSASNAFGWSAKKTMNVAQSLFSQGNITYHRSDSIRVDPQKILDLRARLEKSHGKKYLSKTVIAYGPKSGSQDAHEAVIPTYDPSSSPVTSDEKKLLRLIASRFSASQMADAEFGQVSLRLEYEHGKTIFNFKKNGSTLLFDGFLREYGEIKDDVILPKVSVGQKISWNKLTSSQHFTKPPSRFSDASLIKLLEKEGVGRPSTYASILDTLLNRKYVERKKKSLAATETGIMVSDYLTDSFPSIVDAKFTSDMESNLDKIADGSKRLPDVLEFFNSGLSDQVDSAMEAELPSTFVSDVECPKCSEKMRKKLSKFGPFLACTAWPECDGTAKLGLKENAPETVETGHKCPECSNIVIKRESKRGPFFGCKSYPVCKFTASVGENDEMILREAPKSIGMKCPKCKNGDLIEKTGRYGKFNSCNQYPKCKTIVNIDADGNIIEKSKKKAVAKGTGVTCPKCKKNEVVERTSSNGKFFACSGYPKCKNILKTLPSK